MSEWWIGKVADGSGRDLFYCTIHIFLEGLGKTTRNINQDSWSSSRDLKLEPPKYETWVLNTQPRRSVYSTQFALEGKQASSARLKLSITITTWELIYADDNTHLGVSHMILCTRYVLQPGLYLIDWWDCLSELRPPTSLLFIPNVIHEYWKPWWDADAGRWKLLTRSPELSGNPTSRFIWKQVGRMDERNDNLAL
jgi:hypothetical protein